MLAAAYVGARTGGLLAERRLRQNEQRGSRAMYDRSELLKAAQALTDKIMTGVKAPRRWLSRAVNWFLVCVFDPSLRWR